MQQQLCRHVAARRRQLYSGLQQRRRQQQQHSEPLKRGMTNISRANPVLNARSPGTPIMGGIAGGGGIGMPAAKPVGPMAAGGGASNSRPGPGACCGPVANSVCGRELTFCFAFFCRAGREGWDDASRFVRCGHVGAAAEVQAGTHRSWHFCPTLAAAGAVFRVL